MTGKRAKSVGTAREPPRPPRGTKGFKENLEDLQTKLAPLFMSTTDESLKGTLLSAHKVLEQMKGKVSFMVAWLKTKTILKQFRFKLAEA